MIEIELHRRAQKALRTIPKNRSQQIVEAMKEIACLDDPTLDPNVSMMKGDQKGKWRLRIGEYRAIFRLDTGPEGETFVLLFVTHIGTRGGIYGG